ncbi:MAG: WD40/YVTN/BNR-like repeat-containing protein, partial [Candidatus Kapaibacteriota bacterium]
GGIILRTTDWGKNWQQISLNDSLCTIDMVYFKNKFFGISRFQYTIVSTDDGLTWTLKDFGESTRFYKLFLIDSNLIVVTRGKILIYDENLTLTKEIEIPKKEGFYRDEYLDKISLVNDYFLFQYGSNEMCLLSLKEVTYQIFKVSFPQNTTIRKIIPHSDGVFLYLGNESFYEFNLGNRELTYLGTLPSAFSRVFSSFGNDIYMMCNYYDNRFNVDSLSFGKFRNNSTFENINPVVDRYICQLSFTDMKFKNVDTVIAVGLYKLIMISSDGGRSWVLHSFFDFNRRFYPTFPGIFLFKGKYLRTLGDYLSFFSSNDTGTTWLPPKPIKIDFKENGDFLSVSSRIGTYLTEEKGFYFANVLYIKEPNLAFTADGGDSFSLDTNLSIGNSNSFAGPHLIKYKDYYLFLTSGKLQIKGKWSIINFFRKIDITPEGLKFETISVDSSMQFIFIHNINDTLYAVVQKELDNYFTDTLFVYASYDGAITWDSLYPIFIKRITTKRPYIGSFLEYGNAFLVSVAFENDIYDSFNNFLESIYYLNFQERVFKEIVALSSDTIINPIETKVGKYYLIYGIFRTNQTISKKILFTKNFVMPKKE